MSEVVQFPAPLFACAPFAARELQSTDLARLQAFFDANPAYFFAVTDAPPTGGEAHEELFGELPAGWAYTRKWVLGIFDESGALAGMATIVSDLLAPGVWHIGLFVVATRLHGSGAAQAMYGALETWMQGAGAHWLRLGVVQGNARAERFWARMGYAEVRTRAGLAMGRRVNTVRVMIKPLAEGTLAEYLELIARDRPD